MEWLELAERLTTLTGGALAFLLVILLMRGHLVTSLRHMGTVEQYERLLDERDRLMSEKELELAKVEADRDWWKDATVTALRIGEAVVEWEGRDDGR